MEAEEEPSEPLNTLMQILDKRTASVKVSPRPPASSASAAAANILLPWGKLERQLERQMKVAELSAPPSRLHPIIILHIISRGGPVLDVTPAGDPDRDKLNHAEVQKFHNFCLNNAQTAIVELQSGLELHLVPVRARAANGPPIFWGFVCGKGEYKRACKMLVERRMGLVLDLDETVVVANSTKSFDDKIEAVQRRIAEYSQSSRVAGWQAELERLKADRLLLQQYRDTDTVTLEGRKLRAVREVVQGGAHNGGQTFTRPVIRIPDGTAVLTRIEPEDRGTSMLMHVRPFWEVVRRYLAGSQGRRRYDVWVCTLAEHRYAHEVWRLLDPNAELIEIAAQQERVSLRNVFKSLDHWCHPAWTVVLDDRPNLWEEKDHPNIYAAPPYQPYANPDAEVTEENAATVLMRNVLCNVRNFFFRDVDEKLPAELGKVFADDQPDTLPRQPSCTEFLQWRDIHIVKQDGPAGQAGDASEPETESRSQGRLSRSISSTETQPADAQPMVIEEPPPPSPPPPSAQIEETKPQPEALLPALPASNGNAPLSRPAMAFDLNLEPFSDDEDDHPGPANGTMDNMPPALSSAEQPAQQPSSRLLPLLPPTDTPPGPTRQHATRLGAEFPSRQPTSVGSPRNFVAMLNDYAADRNAMVVYDSLVKPGPSTSGTRYGCEVLMNSELLGAGFAPTKEEAKQLAASRALDTLSARDRTPAQQVLTPAGPPSPVSGPTSPTGIADPKGVLAILALQRGSDTIEYHDLSSEVGSRGYVVEVHVGGRVFGYGEGDTRQEAEAQAAIEALRMYGIGVSSQPSPQLPARSPPGYAHHRGSPERYPYRGGHSSARGGVSRRGRGRGRGAAASDPYMSTRDSRKKRRPTPSWML
eukprot:jgi/Chlat1/1210/Chrsp115S01675